MLFPSESARTVVEAELQAASAGDIPSHPLPSIAADPPPLVWAGGVPSMAPKPGDAGSGSLWWRSPDTRGSHGGRVRGDPRHRNRAH